MGGLNNNPKPGFTLVELLIVIVVIAILAAFSIVAYRGIQNRSHDTAIKSDMNSFAKKISLFQAENGHYPHSIEQLESLNLSISTDSYNTKVDFNNFAYCVWHPDQSDAKVVIGAVSVSNLPYYNYSHEGFTPKVYPGVINKNSSLTDICRDIMGVTPDYDITGYVYETKTWRPWTGN